MGLEISHDIDREGLTLQKVLWPVRFLRPRNNFALAKFKTFAEVNLAEINQVLGTDFQGLIADVDECMAEHHGKILPENLAHAVSLVESGVRLCINSNMRASDRYEPLIEATNGQVQVVMSRYAKPDVRSTLESCEALGLPPEQVVMVGDNPMTDGGSVQAGVGFIRVDPITTPGDSRLKRLPQKAFRSMARGVSDGYDKLGNRAVYRGKEFVNAA